MFCPDCGTWNRAVAAKCVRCGAALPEVKAPPIDVPDEEIRELRHATGNRYAVAEADGSRVTCLYDNLYQLTGENRTGTTPFRNTFAANRSLVFADPSGLFWQPNDFDDEELIDQ
jgi:hypothetical protein